MSTDNLNEMDVLLVPSKWSKRFDHEEVLKHYHKFASEVTEKARKTTKYELDIPYGNSNNTKYDIYGTDLPKDAPIFVFIHGGYWIEGSTDIATFAAPVFVAKGIKVITVGYDLIPHVRLGDIISEIKMALEQILKLASNNGSRCVWVAGHSAGAHLAVNILFDESWLDKMMKERYMKLFKGLVLIAGIYDLTALIDTSINDDLKLTKNEMAAYSIPNDTSKIKSIKGLKVVVTVGECDSPHFINESRKCAQKLITIADDVQYLLLREYTDHFDIVEKLTKPEDVLTKIILTNISST
ncbi:kynurenine formamidase [Nomia melanderi]|uniref:kynurenine formamidase n=1 Tax=Nomia melanderi TaxID=2448451 RepID=UPI00130459DD|nr:kynurenine formamidase [Nomia melanderi]XP_031828964.1 kynurenine formamidase [Nomia melanderi]XP_031828967.1 kynurenine formamidase [Nomia melanderi]